MIFHEKFFQCLAGAIPLFLTPQKIGLLNCRLFSVEKKITTSYSLSLFNCDILS